MIVKALCDYYDRCKDMPQKGTELKEIGYLIVIDEEGKFKHLESCMLDKKHASKFLVLQTNQRSGLKFVSNYLWDNCEYILGYSEKKPSKAILCKESFISMINSLLEKLPYNKNLMSISSFYKRYEDIIGAISDDPLWKEMLSSNKNISFRIHGNLDIAAEDKNLIEFVLSQESVGSEFICLVSGEKNKIARIHSKVSIQGNSFASLISFKDGKGYDSYGKIQGFNASISEHIEFKYTTALNKLLAVDSRNKYQIGNRSFVFWASSDKKVCNEIEIGLWNLLYSEEYDNPNEKIDQVKKVFNTINNGNFDTSLEDKFYILALAPNKSRIAVVYWAEIVLEKFAKTICSHFEDMEIVDNERRFKKPYVGLKSIISAVSESTPNLPDAIVKSIFQGLPYPYTLLASCIRRIRAEQQVPHTPKDWMKWQDMFVGRIAIIKAYLNRLNNNEQKIKVMLDYENNNQGYLCGRLFAVLDRKQEKARKQRTIRERYMNSASATPSMIFPTILKLSRHHEKELRDEKERVWFEKLEQDIVKRISSNGFPACLDLQDQGRFFVGYYHQRQEFFEKKSDNNENE